ncbi:EpsG family protein [Hoylesella nanceiensis]|uniref:EpsG family protein n=1 Tax=Hoylesella nanceiensis TaxID=425941 RepID=UPI0028EB86F3|nr:EpsG family protein [Hoylesella nanceiensis]
MLVYIILASVLGLNATQESGNRSKRDNQLFNIGLLLILLVSGLRYMHGDYGTYEMGFNEMEDVGNDWGYYQIQLLGKKIGLSFQVFVFLISLLAVYSYKKAFSINTFPNFCLIVILGKIFTLYAMSGIRQFIAIAICWWAIKILLDRQKILLFIAMTIIAYSLHASALIILPIVLFYKRKFSYITALVIIIIALIISYSSVTFFTSTADISELVNERLSGYLSRTGNEETMNMLNYFENFLFLFLALVARKEAVKKVPYYDFFLYLFIIYCAFLIAGGNIGIIKRLRDYYIISYAFIIPGIFYLFKEKVAQNITRLLFIAYFIFLFFRSLTVYDSAFHEDEYNRMVPYHSVLEMP